MVRTATSTRLGNLYVSEAFSGKIEIFKAPVVSGSTVFATLTAAFIGGVPAGISTDTSGNLFIAATGHAGVELSPYPANTLLATFGPGTTDAFGTTIGPSGSLYIANATAGGVIDVYDPPFKREREERSEDGHHVVDHLRQLHVI